MAKHLPWFLDWLSRRAPNVRARILRLNPAPLDEGKLLRGYHPHKRSTDYVTDRIGKRKFIEEYGREAWAALPRCAIIQNGHRKSISRNDVLDNLWMLPAGHRVRRARKENGCWVIPAF